MPDPTLAEPEAKPRVLVLTDIGNEPDDSESLVRFLLYTNEFDVENLIATTSVWQRDKVQPDLITQRIDAYAKVWPNLTQHAAGYPTADWLRKRVLAGAPLYGMAGVGKGHDTAASRAIIAAVDRPDRQPLWVLAWGGATDLAQALWHVRATRSQAGLERFTARLRIYSISDQDDAGPWLRQTFPRLFWIASIHGWNQYGAAAWSGISADRRTAENWPDRDKVLDPWLEEHIRRGPLGALYPLPKFIIEGDTPSFLYLIPNGLGDAEHPDWGSWGGRYVQSAPNRGLFADTRDIFERDGLVWAGNQATVYRWRGAFQNDFAARMAWTLTPDRAKVNHAPLAIINGVSGKAALHIQADSGQTITLDATASSDPDGDALTSHCWQYKDVGGIPAQPKATIRSPGAGQTEVVLPRVNEASELHFILELRDRGEPALTSYRRVIVTITPPKKTLASHQP
ncbi:hypothetical protein FHW96_004617 [Novosphingobium sp. SG751A]|uniref:DUF1593 domain-containing protein n=1 Tax=Novosphingobium sp. SG751A TaxID=2587000 RepID=UPI001C12B331|nr:DUF1593 domain-containing protein [Novosphingobium sp. SG751A]NOW48429.1 hypothetical protein [Novosphingobium sp. SG751A]